MGLVIESQYFPSIPYFFELINSKETVIDVGEHFEKQTFRNRTNILGANGVLTLTIPIRHHSPKMRMDEVRVDDKQKWRNNHWRAIQSAYGKAPFFNYYGEYIKDVIYQPSDLLLDFNQSSLTICLKLLQSDVRLTYSKDFIERGDTKLLDLRSIIHPKKDNLSGYSPYPYNQVFGKNFVPNMSILDLLFCEGPSATEVIGRSKR